MYWACPTETRRPFYRYGVSKLGDFNFRTHITFHIALEDKHNRLPWHRLILVFSLPFSTCLKPSVGHSQENCFCQFLHLKFGGHASAFKHSSSLTSVE